MADLLVSSAPTEPVRICPACGDVLVGGACAACAPPPARAYGDRNHASAIAHAAKGFVDSRRAASEWSVGPEELDPHTRKAHPSQLRAAHRDTGLPEPTARGKRQTQVYKKGGAALPAPVPAAAPSRAWSMPEPRPEPRVRAETRPQSTPSSRDEDQAMQASTARHARPVSPLRPNSGPVAVPVQAPAAPAAPAPRPQVDPDEQTKLSAEVAEAPEPAETAEVCEVSGWVETAEPAEPVQTVQAGEVVEMAHRFEPDADPEPDFIPRRAVPAAAWLVLGALTLVGLVVALV